MKRRAKYIRVEQEDLKRVVNGKTMTCISCGDVIAIGNTKGKFNCPNCGWENEIKENK